MAWNGLAAERQNVTRVGIAREATSPAFGIHHRRGNPMDGLDHAAAGGLDPEGHGGKISGDGRGRRENRETGRRDGERWNGERANGV
jgi:hypothetical protein